MYKREQEALLKSLDEHISVGQAKKLLAKRNLYSDVVKVIKPSLPSETSKKIGVAHLASSIDPTKAASTGSSQASSAGASQAASAGASRASSAGASQASSAGASRASSSGAVQITHTLLPGATSKMALSSSRDPKILVGSQNSASSGTRSGSIKDLDEFSLPDIESSANSSAKSPVITVHRSNDGEEQEALSVCRKRAHSLSPHFSSSIVGENTSKEKVEITGYKEGPLAKRLSRLEKTIESKNNNNNSSGKISLSRSTSHRSIERNKKEPKSK